MTDLYLSYGDYRLTVECLIPIAGTGNTNKIRTALGALAEGRERLVESLAAWSLAPGPGA